MEKLTNSHTLSQEIIKGLPELLTSSEVCQILRVHINTFTKLVLSQALPAARVGGQWRVRRQALVKFLRQAETYSKATRPRHKLDKKKVLVAMAQPAEDAA